MSERVQRSGGSRKNPRLMLKLGLPPVVIISCRSSNVREIRTDGEDYDVNFAATGLDGRLPGVPDVVVVERVAVHELCLAVPDERLYVFVAVEDGSRTKEERDGSALFCNKTLSE